MQATEAENMLTEGGAGKSFGRQRIGTESLCIGQELRQTVAKVAILGTHNQRQWPPEGLFLGHEGQFKVEELILGHHQRTFGLGYVCLCYHFGVAAGQHGQVRE